MSDPDFHIETPRLYLSYFQPHLDSHCDFLVRLYNTPEFIASIGGKPTKITTRDSARGCLEGRFRAEHARNGYGTYLVSLKPSPSGGDETSQARFPELLARCEPIGTVSLMRGEGANAYSAPDLGFAILPDQMRKGYAREAAAAVLAYAEKELGVAAVLGLFDPANEASKAVFRSLGFKDRGTRRLKAFGGVEGAVWVKPGMAEDLSVYGFIVFGGRKIEEVKQFIAETEVLKRLKHHRHVVEFVGSYTDPKYFGLIMSPVADMDLSTYLERADASTHAQLRSFFGCLATALDFLHGQRVRHKLATS